LNKTERLAFEWLLGQGIAREEIVFHHRGSPDFVLADGRRFEVKRLYGDSTLVLGGAQFLELCRDPAAIEKTTVLVFAQGEREPRHLIPLREIAEGQASWRNLRIKWNCADSLVLKLPAGSRSALERLARDEGFASIGDFVRELIKREFLKRR
jgi:hypothetical protein